jgi:hypothetical protein
MDTEVRINAINKEVRGLINRRAFFLLHIDAVHLQANIIGTRNITRLKHFDTIDEEAKARLTIQECQDAEKNRIVSNASTVSHASIRIFISFAAIKVYPVWTKGTTHAFLQNENTFSRDQYAEKNRIVSNAPTVSYASIRILISFAAIKVHPVWTKDNKHAHLQSKNTFSRDLYAMLPLELRSIFNGYVLKMLKPLTGDKGGWDILEHRAFQEIGSRKQALLHICLIYFLRLKRAIKRKELLTESPPYFLMALS